MKGYFTKPGKYGSAAGASVEVSKADVEKKNIFDIAPEYAGYFIEAGAFVAGNVKVEAPAKKTESKVEEKK